MGSHYSIFGSFIHHVSPQVWPESQKPRNFRTPKTSLPKYRISTGDKAVGSWGRKIKKHETRNLKVNQRTSKLVYKASIKVKQQ